MGKKRGQCGGDKHCRERNAEPGHAHPGPGRAAGLGGDVLGGGGFSGQWFGGGVVHCARSSVMSLPV